MDPLSLTVSVLTLVTIAAKLVEVGNTYRNALKNQRADVQQLMTEISFLGKVLASIGTTLDGIPQETLSNDAANTGTSPNILRGPLAECEKELLELLRFLASQLEGRNRFTRFGRRLKWPMKEKETKIWIEKIGRFKSTLQIQLQSYTWFNLTKHFIDVATLMLCIQWDQRKGPCLHRRDQEVTRRRKKRGPGRQKKYATTKFVLDFLLTV